MMAQARSLHHVVQQSHKSLKQSLADSPATGYVVPLGHFLSLVVLQPLAAETALKATLMMRMGYFVRGHNLSTLFELLDPDMKKSIDEVYQAILKFTIGEQQVITIAEEPIGDVLERHKNDFERWRYIFELDEASITFIDLHLATQALILNFDVLGCVDIQGWYFPIWRAQVRWRGLWSTDLRQFGEAGFECCKNFVPELGFGI